MYLLPNDAVLQRSIETVLLYPVIASVAESEGLFEVTIC